jgi:hypothetical protein
MINTSRLIQRAIWILEPNPDATDLGRCGVEPCGVPDPWGVATRGIQPHTRFAVVGRLFFDLAVRPHPDVSRASRGINDARGRIRPADGFDIWCRGGDAQVYVNTVGAVGVYSKVGRCVRQGDPMCVEGRRESRALGGERRVQGGDQ